MLLSTFPCDGTPKRIEVQTNTSTLLFSVNIGYTKTSFDSAVAATPSSTVADYILPQLRANLSGNITISRYNKSGTDVLYNNIPLSDLMEICAYGRGMVKHTNVSTSANITAGAYYYKVEFAVPLSNFGSIACDKSTFLVLEYTNPIISNASTITVNAIASYQAGNSYIKLDNMTAQDNTDTDFDCVNNFALIVPASLSKLRLNSQTGETLELMSSELPIVQLATSDIIHQINGALYPSRYWFGVDCMSAYKGRILNASKTPFYLLSNQ